MSELDSKGGRRPALLPTAPSKTAPPSLLRAWALLPSAWSPSPHHLGSLEPPSHFLLPSPDQGGSSLSVPQVPEGAGPLVGLSGVPLWLRPGRRAQLLSGAAVSYNPWSCLCLLPPPFLSGCAPGPGSTLRSGSFPISSFASAQLGPEFTVFGHSLRATGHSSIFP